MKDHIISAIIGLLTLVIGVLFGYYADIFKENRKNEIQYIDIESISSKNTLRKISTKDKGEIKLIWNGNEIDAISKIAVSLYNFSSKDFDNLPLHVSFHPNSSQNIQIVNIQGANESNIEDHKVRDGYPKTDSKGIVTYIFDLGVINRTNNFRPSYTIEFLITGNDLPEAIPSINKKGVKVRKLDYSRLYENDPFTIIVPLAASISLLLIYVGLVVFLIKLQKKIALRKYARYANVLSTYFLDKNQVIKDEHIGRVDQISIDIVHELRSSAWNSLSWIDRLFKRRPPEKKELEEELSNISQRIV